MKFVCRSKGEFARRSIALLILSFLFAAAVPGQDLGFEGVLRQAELQPEFRIEDAYKWLYQATRGGEHAAPDEASARSWMEQEWKTLAPPASDEPLWEPLRPDGTLGRLNLRPFRARGGKMDDLLAAFLLSARSFRGNVDGFSKVWDALGHRLKKHAAGNLSWAEWLRLDQATKTQGYPPVHHSKLYQSALHPAYRVLTGEVARDLIANLPTN